MTVTERIEALVIQWLQVNSGITAVKASIDEDDWAVKTGWGCDTCGPSEAYMELTIWYTTREGLKSFVEVETDPMSFLAELLRLDDAIKVKVIK
ncbi:hypothetical protein [Streptomyces sp. NPDC001422]|uniref:hypothetical protein n=1 Tax=Streptomyces sp. NPDC001422 TaxID=3364575 RepID=UPI0036A57216